MAESRIQLKPDGTVNLGEQVSCDGFDCNRPIRVQTHIHYDHLANFGTSKANQKILMSQGTRDLLEALFDADLPYRNNIESLEFGVPWQIGNEKLQILPSNHMLGSAQVSVTLADGYRVGYSSDFFWPIDETIRVDELIVDATYGDPARTRDYRQSEVDDKVLEVVLQSLLSGRKTAIIGHNGRLQHALHILGESVDDPVVCSPRAYPLVKVYRDHGYAMPPVLASNSDDGMAVLRSANRCLACLTLPETRHLPWLSRFSKVTLSAHMTGPKIPSFTMGTETAVSHSQITLISKVLSHT